VECSELRCQILTIWQSIDDNNFNNNNIGYFFPLKTKSKLHDQFFDHFETNIHFVLCNNFSFFSFTYSKVKYSYIKFLALSPIIGERFTSYFLAAMYCEFEINLVGH